MKNLLSVLLISVCAGLVCIPPVVASEAKTSRLDIDVHEAPAEVVLERIAGAMGMNSRGIDGDDDPVVTMTLLNVTPRTALRVLSESLGACVTSFRATDRSVQLICGDHLEASQGSRSGGPGLDETISVTLRDARFEEVLGTLARASGLKIVVAEELKGSKVTLEVEDLPIRQVLTVLCRTNGCSWDQTSESTIEISASDP